MQTLEYPQKTGAWRYIALSALLGVSFLCVAAILGGLLFFALRRTEARVTEPPPRPTPTVAAQPKNVDDGFLAELSRHGILLQDVPVGIESAKITCDAIKQGRSVQSMIDITVQKSPTLTYDQAVAAVKAAIHAYCPEVGDQ